MHVQLRPGLARGDETSRSGPRCSGCFPEYQQGGRPRSWTANPGLTCPSPRDRVRLWKFTSRRMLLLIFHIAV